MLHATEKLALDVSGLRDWSNPDNVNGRIWETLPDEALTMIGKKRLMNINDLLIRVILSPEEVPGDFIETGVWRGGCCIFARGILDDAMAYHRKVWLADSFQGLPKPDLQRYPEDLNDPHHTHKILSVSLDKVKANITRMGFSLDGFVFLPGWFHETLPTIDKDQKFCLIRLDGDMYGSTMDALLNLYPKLSVGGFCVVDDYGSWPKCKQAVHDYRKLQGITSPIKEIDGYGVFWQKSLVDG